MVQPDSLADDLGRKSMTVMRIGRWHHIPVSPTTVTAAKPDYRDNPQASVSAQLDQMTNSGSVAAFRRERDPIQADP
jgi:hypothetical protein